MFVKFIPGVSSYIRSTPKESMESVLLSIRGQFVKTGDTSHVLPMLLTSAHSSGEMK